jgi:hypothetical protein
MTPFQLYSIWLDGIKDGKNIRICKELLMTNWRGEVEYQ